MDDDDYLEDYEEFVQWDDDNDDPFDAEWAPDNWDWAARAPIPPGAFIILPAARPGSTATRSSSGDRLLPFKWSALGLALMLAFILLVMASMSHC